ncbi:MAG: carboxypeptidase regulatory-like domain-containing protein, partial [Planctomycetota bacterium]
MRSRRALLVGFVVALGAWAAQGVARGDEVERPARLLVLGPDGQPVDTVFATECGEMIAGRPLFVGDPAPAVLRLKAGLLAPVPPAPAPGSRLVLWHPEFGAVVVPDAGGAIGIRLASVAPLTGSIRYAEGKAAAGLTLFAIPESPAVPAHRTVTDEQGAYVFPQLAPGRYRLRLRRGDGRQQDLGVYPAGAVAADTQIVSGASFTGRIFDADASRRTGVAELAFRLVPLPRGAAGIDDPASTTTDADGAFLLADLLPGVYEAELLDTSWHFEPSPPRVEVSRDVDIALPAWFVLRKRSVVGRVVDLERRPIEDVALRLVPDPTRSPPPDGWGPPRVTRTDPEGRFFFDLVRPASGYRIALAKPGYAPFVSDAFDLGRSGDVELPAFEMKPGWRLEARVRAAGGRPVPGALVRAGPADRPLRPDDPLHATFVREARTNADGRAILQDLPATDVRAVAALDGMLDVEDVIPFPRSGDARAWTATLLAAPEVTGQVREDTGVDPPAVRVRATPRDGSAIREADAEADGRFRLRGLPAVPTDLEVRLQDTTAGPPLATYLGVVPGAGDEVLILLPERVRVAGTVEGLQPGGGPAAVLLEAPIHDPEDDTWRWRAVSRVAVDPSGPRAPFAFEGLVPGGYALRAIQARRDSDAVPILLDAGDLLGVELLVPGGGRIAGIVLDDRDLPLLGASVDAVRLRGDGDAPRPDDAVRTTTGAGGDYVFDGLAPGLWRVTARDRTSSCDLEIVRVGEGESVLLRDLLPGRGGDLEGTVTDGAGRALAGARLQLEAREEGVPPRHLSTATDGTYRVTSLRPGAWRVRLEGRVGAFTGLEALAEIVAGEVTRLDLSAEGRGTIEGTVRRRGLPVADVTVHLLSRASVDDPSLRRLRARTDASGRFHWSNLEGGEYLVDLVDGVIRSSSSVFLVEGDRLTRDRQLWSGRLVGEVRTLSGRAVGSALVVAQ